MALDDYDDEDLKQIHKDALERFKDSSDAWKNNMRRYEEDVKFARMGEQWDENDAERRKQDGRPMLTVNRMPSFIRQVANDARQNKPQIKVAPQDNDADPETAEVINGLIRNIEATSKSDLAYDTATDCAASGGFGYIRVDVDWISGTFEKEILIDRVINPLTVYPDAASTSADGSDWRYCFITEMMEEDEFKEAYPDADPINWQNSEITDREALWFQDRTVRVAEYWCCDEEDYTLYLLSNGQVVTEEDWEDMQQYLPEDMDLDASTALDMMGLSIVDERKSKKPVVKRYVMNGQEVLEVDEWAGRYIPVVPVYGEEVYHGGERNFFSLIHFAKDSQLMYNYWRTTTTELVALAPKNPWVGAVGQFETDQANWQNSASENVGILEYDQVDGAPPPMKAPFAGPPAGALQEALNASDDMKSVLGLYDASMGAQSNEISGVAISKRVREGDTSTFHFIDNMTRAVRQVGIIILDLIPSVYSTDRMIRVLGDDGTPQTVRVNAPPQSPQETLQGEQIDRMEAMQAVYDLSVGRYDVSVKAGPSYTTLREEARDSMIALLQAFPQAAGVTGDLVVEAMDWPNADAFAKRLKAILPPGIVDEEEDPQKAQMANQIQQMEAVIEQLASGQEAKMAEIAVDREKVSIDAQNAQTNLIKAETDRMKAEADARLKEAQMELDRQKAMAAATPDEAAAFKAQVDADAKKAQIDLDQKKAEQDAIAEQQRLALEQERVDLERERLEIEKAKMALEKARAVMPIKAKPEAPSIPTPSPASVVNVMPGSKRVTIQRDADGNIVGADVQTND